MAPASGGAPRPCGTRNLGTIKVALHERRGLFQAEAVLLALANELDTTHPSPRTGSPEGLRESLIVLRLDVPPTLARTLPFTNAIESMTSMGRDHDRNVRPGEAGRPVRVDGPRAMVPGQVCARRRRPSPAHPNMAPVPGAATRALSCVDPSGFEKLLQLLVLGRCTRNSRTGTARRHDRGPSRALDRRWYVHPN